MKTPIPPSINTLNIDQNKTKYLSNNNSPANKLIDHPSLPSPVSGRTYTKSYTLAPI